MSNGQSHQDDDKSIERKLDDFRLRMQALRALAETQLKHAQENQSREEALLIVKGAEARDLLMTTENINARDYGHAAATLIDASKELMALQRFSHEHMLAEILFVSVFSGFDAYLNYLLRDLYSRRPNLLNKLQSRLVSFADVLNRTKTEIVDANIDKDIDSLLRESYTVIFDKLAKRFDLNTLTEFDNWPAFIECSQRRHIIIHCDGIVSKQYLSQCAASKSQLPPGVVVGSKLSVSKDYLLKAIEVVSETGLKLGQVLWRASSEQSTHRADEHLGNLLYELLKLEHWTLALRMGEFGMELEKRKHKKPRKELTAKIILVNYAQAAKWSGDRQTALKLIDGFDWSGSAAEFRFAVACLREEWDNAAALMQGLKDSPIMPLHGICKWPILREFRETKQFVDAFKATFGVEFAEEIGSIESNAGSEPKENDDASGPHPPIDCGADALEDLTPPRP